MKSYGNCNPLANDAPRPKKIYIGWCPHERRYRLFRLAFEPTRESHGSDFSVVIGPFRTLAGAHFMIDYGHNNPHCQTVDDAERLAER